MFLCESLCVYYINLSVCIFKLYENLYFKTSNLYNYSSYNKINCVILCKIHDKQYIYNF